MDAKKKIEGAINILNIPMKLRDDAVQEGWLAHLEGRSVMGHLKSWYEREKKHQKKHVLFSEMGKYDIRNETG